MYIKERSVPRPQLFYEHFSYHEASKPATIDGLFIGDCHSVKNQDRMSSSSYVQNESMLGTIHVYPYSPIP